MKILIKTEIEKNVELDVVIGLKSQYKEFDNIENAFSWIFTNKNLIKSYKIFEIYEYGEKKNIKTLTEPSIVNLSSGVSFGQFN